MLPLRHSAPQSNEAPVFPLINCVVRFPDLLRYIFNEQRCLPPGQALRLPSVQRSKVLAMLKPVPTIVVPKAPVAHWHDEDVSFEYDGPKADIATVTGGPFLGLGDSFDAFAEVAGKRNVVRVTVARPKTPYGKGPRVETYCTSEGYLFLRIPMYGQVIGEDPVLSEVKMFWILWQAGVKVLISGGLAGSCDVRTDGDASVAKKRSWQVHPGDLVLPFSYIGRDNMPDGLPMTPLEFCFPRQVAIMEDPFCSELSATLAALAAKHKRHTSDPSRKFEQQAADASSLKAFRKIHEAREHPVVLSRKRGANSFESVAESLQLMMMGQKLGMPAITGDLISPVLARLCGMHLVVYNVVTNWATGLGMVSPSLAGLGSDVYDASIDRVFLEWLPRVAVEMELDFLERWSDRLLEDCKCEERLVHRPEGYDMGYSPEIRPTLGAMITDDAGG